MWSTSFPFALLALLATLSLSGCHLLSPGRGPEESYLVDQGDPTDSARALARACDADDEAACMELAEGWALGQHGDGPDVAHARELAEAHCTPGADICVLLVQLRDPWGVWGYPAYSGAPVDELRDTLPRELEEHCRAGNNRACSMVTQLREKWFDVDQVTRTEVLAERREEARRREAEEEARRRAEARANVRDALRARAVDCNGLHTYYSVPHDVCAALSDAVEDGRTNSRGRDAIRSYLHDRGVRHLRGYIIARLDAGLYEAVRRSHDSYWDISYPSGQHFMLLTTRTGYTSRGRFDMWVTEQGTHDVETVNGFVETWNIYGESEVGQLWQEVRDARAGEATRDAAVALLQYFARSL